MANQKPERGSSGSRSRQKKSKNTSMVEKVLVVFLSMLTISALSVVLILTPILWITLILLASVGNWIFQALSVDPKAVGRTFTSLSMVKFLRQICGTSYQKLRQFWGKVTQKYFPSRKNSLSKEAMSETLSTFPTMM